MAVLWCDKGVGNNYHRGRFKYGAQNSLRSRGGMQIYVLQSGTITMLGLFCGIVCMQVLWYKRAGGYNLFLAQ